jgi:hypothetical protein
MLDASRLISKIWVGLLGVVKKWPSFDVPLHGQILQELGYERSCSWIIGFMYFQIKNLSLPTLEQNMVTF